MKTSILICFVFLFLQNTLLAQCDPVSGQDLIGRPCGGTIQTAVPFLRITPDARSGAMGDVGIALSPDANAMHFNASKLAMAEEKFGVSFNYTPWLHNLGVDDIYLAYLSSYLKFGKNKNKAIGLSVRYFSLGEIQWTNYSGTPLGTGHPREFEIACSYSQKLNQYLSLGITAKFINSNLASGQSPGSGTSTIHDGRAGAVDISITYKKPIKFKNNEGDFTFGAAISNIGNKINYFQSSDFLPTNLGIGTALNLPFDKNNRIVFALDFNKYLVPTPQPLTTDPTQSWRTTSPIAGIFKSFYDAPGGFGEELQEISISSGVEYWFKNTVALRGGYFYEDKTKGGRQYLTTGAGVKLKSFGFNLSYLIPTSNQRGPLDNTIRFSALYSVVSK